jgi:hypothetical protein
MLGLLHNSSGGITINYYLWTERDSDPRKTTLESASSIYKRQTRSLVREDAHKNRAVIVKDYLYLVVSPRWVLYSKTNWPTDCRS